MPDEDRLKLACDERARIRQAALRMAYAAGMGCIVAGILRGGSVARVLALAIIGSVLGLVCWWAYHRISRRNDGLAIILTTAIMSSVPADRADIPVWRHGVTLLTTTLPLTCLFARKLRDPKPKPHLLGGADPLFDGDIDHPIL